MSAVDGAASPNEAASPNPPGDGAAIGSLNVPGGGDFVASLDVPGDVDGSLNVAGARCAVGSLSVLGAGELRELCTALRAGRLAGGHELITAIEGDLEQYHRAPVTQEPPPQLAEVLPLMGWLIHEAAASTTDYGLIVRAADAARAMPWPEYAVRALGAFRAQALAEAAGDSALAVHREARNRHASFLAYHRSREPDAKDPYLRALDEMLVHLAPAEIDTACRLASQLAGGSAGRPADGAAPSPADSAVSGLAESTAFGPADGCAAGGTTRLAFDRLASGADIGEQALAAATRVKRRHGFVDTVCEEGLTLPESLAHLGAATARALLLMLKLCPSLERLGADPPGSDKTWEDTRERLHGRFAAAYDYAELPIEDSAGHPLEPSAGLRAAIAWIRRHSATS